MLWEIIATFLFDLLFNNFECWIGFKLAALLYTNTNIPNKILELPKQRYHTRTIIERKLTYSESSSIITIPKTKYILVHYVFIADFLSFCLADIDRFLIALSARDTSSTLYTFLFIEVSFFRGLLARAVIARLITLCFLIVDCAPSSYLSFCVPRCRRRRL